MSMASAAMQQQQQLHQLDPGHQSSSALAQNRHQLSMNAAAGVAASSPYYHHHQHQHQHQHHQHHTHHQQQQQQHQHNQYQSYQHQNHYAQAYQSEHLPPRALSSALSGANQMEDQQNQLQNQHLQHSSDLARFNQSNEFYYQQAANSLSNQETANQQHYYSEARAYSAAAVAAAAVAVPVVGYVTSNQIYTASGGVIGRDQQYSSLSSSSSNVTPSSTSSNGNNSSQYQFAQSFNQATSNRNQDSTMQQSYATPYMNESYQEHQLQLNALIDQARSVEGQDECRNKIESRENCHPLMIKTNKVQQDLISNSGLGENVLTELGPKSLHPKIVQSQTVKRIPEVASADDLSEPELQSNSKKRKKSSKSSSYKRATVKEEEQQDYTQLESAYQKRARRSVGGGEEVDEVEEENCKRQQRRAPTRIDQSLAGGTVLSSTFDAQTNDNHQLAIRADVQCNELELERHQSYSLPARDECEPATTQNHHHHHQHHHQNQNQQHHNHNHSHSHLNRYTVGTFQNTLDVNQTSELQLSPEKQDADNGNTEYNQLRLLEMRKEKSRDAARSRRSKENHEFYELAKLLPLPAAITSQLDFLDKASIIRLTISFLKLRQFSVNGHPPWAPDFTTLGSINPYSSQPLNSYNEQFSAGSQDDSLSRPTSVGPKQVQQNTPIPTSSTSTSSSNHPYKNIPSSGNIISDMGVSNECRLALPPTMPTASIAFAEGSYHQQAACIEKNLIKNTSSLFDIHQGTHILQSLDGFAFAIGRDGRFLYISETVSMYLGLSQVEMTGSSVFDYAHQQDHEELAKQLGIPYTSKDNPQETTQINSCESPQPASVHSQYSAASNETLIEDHINSSCPKKRAKTSQPTTTTTTSSARGAYGRNGKKAALSKTPVKIETSTSDMIGSKSSASDNHDRLQPTNSGKETGSWTGSTSQGTDEDPLVRQFCIRMKSTLTKRGCQHFKSSGYRVVHVVAHLRSYQSNDHGHLMDPLDEAATLSSGPTKQTKRRGIRTTTNKDGTTSLSSKETIKGSNENPTNSDTRTLDTNTPIECGKQKIIGMVAVAIALPPPSINELRLESGTFVLRLSLDLRVTHIEPKITELLHYPVELIAGRSLYSLVHPADVHQVQKCHKDLLRKGQMMSGYYRLLSRNGGYIWIQTCATLICNNTFVNQAPILPSSPMPTPINVGTSHHEHQHKLTGYLAPPNMNTSAEQFNASGSGNHSKIMSPGLSSHLSSNYDNQDQDQCVIFVNYMITNIVESNEIMDICQSSDYTPLSSFSGSTNSNVVFNSPSSSCSSPCLANIINKATCGSQYNSPSTPNSNNNNSNSNNNLSSPSRRQHQHNHHHHHGESKLRSAEMKGGASERRSNSISKVKQQIYSSASSNSNENDLGHNTTSIQNNSFSADQIGLNKVDNSVNQHERVLDTSGVPSSTATVYGYPQTPGSVNLALNKPVHGTDTSSWLTHHHPSATGRLSDTSAVYGTNQVGVQATNHYSTMNRSIYKAAFGLPDVSGATYNHQQSAAAAAAAVAGVYPNAANAAAVSYPSAAGVTNTSWDTAAAAAVAAASNHLTNHHHSARNPYHLESHQAAHSIGNNHHTSAANTYYNYYGYYGNKFI